MMATISRPKLLLLDEHTAALDPRAAEQIMFVTDQLECFEAEEGEYPDVLSTTGPDGARVVYRRCQPPVLAHYLARLDQTDKE